MGTPTILVLTSDRPLGRVIRWFTAGPASHVAIGLGDHVLHARGAGVIFEPRERLGEQHYARLAEYAIQADVRSGLGHVLGQLGKPYDVGDLFGWLVRPRRRAVKLDGARDRWTCVRLALALDPERTQIPEWYAIDPGLATPTDLWRSMEGGLSFVRVA